MHKKEFDSIQVPHNVNEYIKSGIRRAEEEKHGTKWLKGKFWGTALAVSMAIIVTIGITNPTFAKDIPILKEIFKYFEGNGEVPDKGLSRNAKQLNITREINGVKVTIEEAICDGQSVYLTYRVDNKEVFPYLEAEDISNLDDIEIVNGEYINPEFEMYPIEELTVAIESYDLDYLKNDNREEDIPLQVDFQRSKAKIINNKTAVGILKFELLRDSEGQVPDLFNLSFTLTRMWLPPQKYMDTNNSYSIDDVFKFDIPVKVDKSNFEEIEVNEVKDGFKLEKIIKTPYYIEVKVVPLNAGNQKNILSTGAGKEPQLQDVFIIGSSGINYGYGSPQSFVIKVAPDDIEGTSYAATYGWLDENEKYYEIVVQDNVRSGQPCTKECENPEHHQNSLHPKIIKFDTKIYPKK